MDISVRQEMKRSGKLRLSHMTQLRVSSLAWAFRLWDAGYQWKRIDVRYLSAAISGSDIKFKAPLASIG